ncbi:MAG TPA: hypothetical protein RMH99_02580, partial [Sandaracinaceae bacterium LLY-WYZ-13_1]|nr:hypothetical protein [Sandaracinaceae bacterium LLY-WYZ-13_1]
MRVARDGWPAILLAGLLAGTLGVVATSCGDDDEEASGSSEGAEGEGAEGESTGAPEPTALLEEEGTLDAEDAEDDRGHYDRYFVDVGAQDRILVTLTSSAFDPILEVTPPGSGTLVNDDWRGDRTRSQLELIAPQAGSMKVEVRSYEAGGAGDYALVVRRVTDEADASADVPMLTAGQSADGELAEGDHSLSGGDRFDSFVVRVGDEPARIAVTTRGQGEVRTTLVGPRGHTLEPSEGRYEASAPGSYRLQVLGSTGTRYRVRVEAASEESTPLLARAHHRFNELLAQLAGTERQSAAGSSGSSGSGSP